MKNLIIGKLIGMLLMAAIIFALSSCQRDGYGCKGNNRIMTRVR